MEKEINTMDFDFTKKVVKIVEPPKPLVSEATLRKIKFASFLALGALAFGVGIGLTNGFVQGYKISQESKARIAEIHAKNEATLKAKNVEVDAQIYAQQAQLDFKEKQKEKVLSDQLALENDKAAYNLWVLNKSDVIANYEAQLVIYDKAYQTIMQGVKVGLLSLDDLGEIRQQYQYYKKNIHEWIQFINEDTNSFETFSNLNKEHRTALDNELLKYQSGDLNRNNDLENLFINKISESNQDSDDEKLAKLRKDMRNQMIDDLADVLNNENATTKHKKLKR